MSRNGEIKSLPRFIPPEENAVLCRPDLMDDLCDHIAAGGSMQSWSEQIGVRRWIVARWIQMDEHRMRRFEDAVKLGEDWIRSWAMDILSNVAGADIAAAVDADGRLLPMHELPPSLRMAITEYTENEQVNEKRGGGSERRLTRRIKLDSRLKAVELMGRKLGLWVDKVEHNVAPSLEELIVRSKTVEEVRDADTGTS